MPVARTMRHCWLQNGLSDSEYTYMTTESAHENKAELTWVFSGKYNCPMNIMLVIMMDKLLGKDMEESLANLKTTLEK